MSRGAQASAAAIVSRAPVLAVLALVLPVLGGCMGGGASKASADPDPTILTGAVEPTAPAASVDYQSDEATIRNAVSAADLEIMAGAPLPWANADTGSRGAVHALAEVRDGANVCRSFTASRESFDGVAIYRGEACMVAPGRWRMEQFRPL